MSLQVSKSSANDFALPKTSTPAGHKRAAGRQRPSTRPSKKRRVMPVQAVAEEEPDYDSSKSRPKESSRNGVLNFLSDMFKSVSLGRSENGASNAPPSSSSSKTIRDYQPNHSMYEGTSKTMDTIMEPEDDTLFPSPLNIPQDLPSTSSLNTDGSTITRRREPMYNAEARDRGQNRREKKMKALNELNGQWRPRHQGSNQSSSHGDVSSTTISSPTYNESGISSGSRIESSRTVSRHSGGYSKNPLGIDAYRKLLNNGSIFGVRPSYKTSDRDVLAIQRPESQNFASVNRALEIAKDSLNTPKPKAAKSSAYRKSNLRDEQLSAKIDDYTRRRRIWPDAMPSDNEKIIRAVLTTPGLVASLPAAEVSQKDIIKLKPGEWLNDEVINFYGVMVNIRSGNAKARRDKGFAEPGDDNLLDVHVFSSFFFQNLTDRGYSNVRRWTKKFDFFKKDIVIMPINLGNMHWVCAAINVEKQRFEYYDSMGKINYNVLAKLREYVQEEHKDKKKKPIDLSGWEDYSNPKTPQQANGYDCGVFASQFIECLSRRDGHFDFEQKNMPYLRKKMIHEIKMMQFAPEQWSDPNAR